MIKLNCKTVAELIKKNEKYTRILLYRYKIKLRRQEDLGRLIDLISKYRLKKFFDKSLK